MAKVSLGFVTEKINGITINTSYKCNSGNYTNSSSRDIKYVVIHYTGNASDTPLANCKYFQSSGRNASAHFFVKDKEIYQSVEVRDAAWAIGCSMGYKTDARNANSVSIEMCTSGNYTCSKQTQITSAYMAAYLCKLAGITASKVDAYVLRHYDCVKSNKKCPLQYVNDVAEWKEFKTMVKNILETGSHEAKASTASTPVKVAYSGTFPTLPSRGYFKTGDTGTQVKNLQKLLNWAVSAGLTVDGDLGAKTVAAVKKFQSTLKVTADGLFGKSTLEKAKAYKK